MAVADLRQRIEGDLGEGRWGLAHRHLVTFWEREPTLATAGFLLRAQERLREHVALLPYRVAILRSFTVEPMVALLRSGAFAGGIDLTVTLGGFNAYGPEMLDAQSALYRFQPELVILAVQARDLAPQLWERGGEPPAPAWETLARAPGSFRDYVAAFRAHSGATLVIHDLQEPEPEAGPHSSRLLAAVRAVNEELRLLSREHPGVHVLPYADLVARHGARTWGDARNLAAMNMPIANENLIHLVRQWLRFIHPASGRLCKALVTDLDDTLWGGVLGEDGLEGIVCGEEGRGRPYRALQEALLELRARGILLAVCSKNDEAEALSALEKGPGLLLRPPHFAALRINWRDKPANLREIAAELNVGTDALAFLDDSPVERERMRSEMPEVTVIEPPASAEGLAWTVRDHPMFARLTLSAEDEARQRHYAEQRERLGAMRAAPTLDAFYHSLAQEVAIERMTRETAERAAQLTQKTNQFNLTTRRYTAAELLHLAESGEGQVFTARVRDCYGDNGLTGLAIVRPTPLADEIDTFLLSCRVIGRGVEVALLAFLTDHARARGRQMVRGRFIPTRKNALVADFFPSHGFEPQEEAPEGSVWVADPSRLQVLCPAWIRLSVASGVMA